MKDKILDIIRSSPRHYTRILKSNTELHQWIQDNSLVDSDHYPTMVRSAVYGESPLCEYGNHRQLKRFHNGFQGCGPARSCKCTQKNISQNVKSAKSNQDHSQSNDKRKNTMMKKYGVAYNSQRESIKKILKKPKIAEATHKLLSDRDWLHDQYIVQQKTSVQIAQEIGVYYGTVLDYCRQFGFDIQHHFQKSAVEKDIANYVKCFGVKIIENDRSVLDGNELDIYVPIHNFAIEVNGLYWHSYNPNSPKPENRFRHSEKSKKCTSQNISLLHITDYDWYNHQSAVKNVISSKLNQNNRVYARNTQVKNITKQTEQEFLDRFHLQGWCPSTKKLGLFHNNQLLAVATFGKPRFDKSCDAELLRLCFAGGTSVVGGVSKLMKHSGYESIVSYTKNDLGIPSLHNAGFVLESEGNPGYFWTDGTNKYSRYQTQKSKLPKFLGKKYNSSKSEAQNMFDAGFRRYWDTGNSRWIWKS